MIHSILFCILWSKPNTALIEAPINEYAMAAISQDLGEFHFEADVIEEKLNSLKIVHTPTQFSTMAYSEDDRQRTMYVKMEMAEKAASLTCEIRPQQENP